MFTDITWQDFEAAGDREKALVDVVAAYKASPDFAHGLDALAYFAGENRKVGEKVIVKLDAVTAARPDGSEGKKSVNREVVGNRIANNFLFRFITQQNQFLLSYGPTLGDERQQDALGRDFGHALEQLGERALLLGVSYGFWNVDHLEVLPAVVDAYSGCVALVDEMGGTARAAVQFWKLDTDKPMYIRFFEADGVTLYRYEDAKLQEAQPKRAYRQRVRADALGTEVVGAENYPALPVVPLYANRERRSEFSPNIKSKIDLYDTILSDYGDNLERCNDIYWVISNFGGTSDEVVEMLAEINRIKATYVDDDHASAQPHTFEVPYQARQTALGLLERSLYKDFMALNMDEIRGGSLTNVAIRAAMADLELKANRYEWQCVAFVREVLRLLGIDTDEITFKRQTIANDSEVIQDIYTMRSDIDRETALKLNPYITAEEIPTILQNLDAEEVAGMPDMKSLQRRIDEEEREGDEA